MFQYYCSFSCLKIEKKFENCKNEISWCCIVQESNSMYIKNNNNVTDIFVFKMIKTLIVRIEEGLTNKT